MVRLLFTATLLTCASTWATTGSVYREPCTHVGVRGHSDLSGAAITVKITTDYPVCPREGR